MAEAGWEERVRALAQTQHGAVTRAQVLEAGGTADLIKKRLHRGAWKLLLAEGYQVIRDEKTEHLGRILCATLRANGVATRRTAARLFGMDAFDDCDVVEIRAERDLRFDGVHVYQGGELPKWARTVRDGIPTTNPLWTLIDLCRVASRDDLECAMDHCLRMNWTTFERLQKACAYYEKRSLPGISKLREILELRAPQFKHTDSVLETRCLQVLRTGPFPKPVLQYEIVHNGNVIAKADLAFPERHVLIETLGAKWHREKKWQLTRDCTRENAIHLLKRYQVLKFSWDQVTRKPETVIGDVAEALGIPIQQSLNLRPRSPIPAPGARIPASHSHP